MSQEPTIEVRANRLGGIAGKEWHHAYIVYTDADGRQCFLRGGPSGNGEGASPLGELSGGASRSSSVQSTQASTSGLSYGSGSNPASASDKQAGGPYGAIQTETRWLDTRAGTVKPIDYHPDEPYKTTVVSRGPQCEGQFLKMSQEMQSLQATNTRYSPLGPNSNTCVADGLRSANLPEKLPEGVWAPGFDQHIDTSKVTQAQRNAVVHDGNHEVKPPGAELEKTSDEPAVRRQSLKDKMRGSVEHDSPERSKGPAPKG